MPPENGEISDPMSPKRRSHGANFRRFTADLRSTPIWWRSDKVLELQRSERTKIEVRVAKSDVGRINIAKNYQGKDKPDPLRYFEILGRHRNRRNGGVVTFPGFSTVTAEMKAFRWEYTFSKVQGCIEHIHTAHV